MSTAPEATAATEVWVVPTGTSNQASMLAALERVGGAPRVLEQADPERIVGCERLVLPGVGAFGATRETLVERGFWAPLRQRLEAGRPTLLVCLGLQLLCEGSAESPGVPGLGLLPETARRFPARERVPQLGWSFLEAPAGCRYLRSGFGYFANSYYLKDAPQPWRVARARHGVLYAAALERGSVLACQFHPELSGKFGLGIIERWLRPEPELPRGPSAPPRGLRPLREAAKLFGKTVRLIPCLDVRDGRIVKGVRFAGLRDAGDPAERASLYETQGADEIVILDVSATPEGRRARRRTVEKVRARVSIPLTVGGGVRSVEDAERLLLAGADKVAVNTAALADPDLLDALARRFGRQCTVVSIDASADATGKWEVLTHSGTRPAGRDAVAWAQEAVRRGAGEVLLTSLDRDGTRAGYDLALLRAVTQAVPVPVIASGGAAGAEHLGEALQAGADAVLAASIFHDGDVSVAEVKAALRRQGIRVRP